MFGFALLKLFIPDDEHVFIAFPHEIMFTGIFFLGQFKIFGFFAGFLNFLLVVGAVGFEFLLGAVQAVLGPEAVLVEEYEHKEKDYQREVVLVLQRGW